MLTSLLKLYGPLDAMMDSENENAAAGTLKRGENESHGRFSNQPCDRDLISRCFRAEI